MFNNKYSRLVSFSVQIYKAISNSVASEKTFSTINLIYNKLHNWLEAKKADKLIYIYINQQVLVRNNSIYIRDLVNKT